VNVTQVDQLWRHPVKSMQGERLLEAVLNDRGQQHDREYGVIDRRSGRVLSGKTMPQLMFGRARLDGGTVVVAVPGGADFDAADPAGAATLSAWLDRDVFLEHAERSTPRDFQVQESVMDSEPPPTAPVRDVRCPPGTFLDSAPVQLVDAGWLRGDDVRRFRPTALLRSAIGDTAPDAAPLVEDGWVGRTVQIGSATLRVAKVTKRCAMVQRPQPGLAKDVDLARTLIHEYANVVGVYATVLTAGRITLGDIVHSH
jgi:uncharacterized protein YcbX